MSSASSAVMALVETTDTMQYYEIRDPANEEAVHVETTQISHSPPPAEPSSTATFSSTANASKNESTASSAASKRHTGVDKVSEKANHTPAELKSKHAVPLCVHCADSMHSQKASCRGGDPKNDSWRGNGCPRPCPKAGHQRYQLLAIHGTNSIDMRDRAPNMDQATAFSPLTLSR